MRTTVIELSGPPAGPPLAPVDEWWDRVASLGDRWSAATDAAPLRPFELLVGRAMRRHAGRRGRTSVGGAARLLLSGDARWLAINLARPSDLELLPAWLETAPDTFVGLDEGVRWDRLEAVVADRGARQLVDRAVLLGLAVAEVGEARHRGRLVMARPVAPRAPFGDLSGCRIVDLSSLWAGPLCTRLLADAGAEVIKVESVSRLDAARHGDPELFEWLHRGKRTRRVEFRTAAGRDELRELLDSADIVVEGSRPRALRQLGLHAEEFLGSGGPKLWLSITAYGRDGSAGDRVGFGDDTAAAAGLVVADASGPYFCGDAVADPLTGIAAAVAVAEHARREGAWLLDVSLASVAAMTLGPPARSGPQAETRARSR